MTTQKVLVTGASGLIGGLIVEHLADKYEFSALNRRPVDGIPCTQADISDLDAILPAFEDVEMVVHMANYIDDVFDWEKHLSAGIIGTRNVFEAARIHGIRRVVYGSTGDTQTGYEYDKSLPYGHIGAGKYDDIPDDWPMITHLDPVRPKSVYGACKVFGEALPATTPTCSTCPFPASGWEPFRRPTGPPSADRQCHISATVTASQWSTSACRPRPP